MQENSKRITVDEIAEELNLDRRTVYQMLKEGSIPNVRAGRLFIVSRQAFNRWLETCGTNRQAIVLQ